MKLIKVGCSSKEGNLYREYNKAKSCHICKHFVGYGLHAVAGKCTLLDKEIGGGYTGNYSKVAQECESFDCKLEFLGKLEEY